MKKFLFIVALLLATVNAEALDIKLVKPDTDGGKGLLSMIKERRTGRNIDTKMLSDKHLSELLWVNWGISSEDGKRVVPTARNLQDMELYVLLPSGAYIYDAENNLLKQVSTEDMRALSGTSQKFAEDAPVHLLYVTADKKYGGVHAGSMYQNAGLYCAMENLACVVRGLYDHEGLKQALKLDGEKEVVMTFVAGYQK